MPEPQYHQVLCSLTEEEYHEMTAAHAGGTRQHQPLLYGTIQGDGDTFCEDDITLIVRDCLIELNSNDDLDEFLGTREREHFDATTLPYEVKAAVMDAARDKWSPPRQSGNHHDGSYWREGPEEARKLLDAHPELAGIFGDPGQNE